MPAIWSPPFICALSFANLPVAIRHLCCDAWSPNRLTRPADAHGDPSNQEACASDLTLAVAATHRSTAATRACARPGDGNTATRASMPAITRNTVTSSPENDEAGAER